MTKPDDVTDDAWEVATAKEMHKYLGHHAHCENIARALDSFAYAAVKAERADAERYRFLRSQPVTTMHEGGVFAGKTPENFVLNGDDLDQAVDEAIRDRSAS